MHIAYKIWFEKGDQPVLDTDICELMLLIRETGSISKAAECLGISYRAAWGKIKKCEASLNFELTEKGHTCRAGTHLSEAANTMLDYYEQIILKMDKCIVDKPVHKIIQRINKTILIHERYQPSKARKNRYPGGSEGLLAKLTADQCSRSKHVGGKLCNFSSMEGK